MELKLTISTTVKSIKEQFSRSFPYLKLEFFTRHFGGTDGCGKEGTMNDDLYLWELSGVLKEGIYNFAPAVSVEEFEQTLQYRFGLPVEVFRKYGSCWETTHSSDDLSLEKHNAIGEAATRRESSGVGQNQISQ